MKGGKLYKTEYGEMTTVKRTFQRRICRLLEALVLSSEAKHDKNKHGDLLQKKTPHEIATKTSKLRHWSDSRNNWEKGNDL